MRKEIWRGTGRLANGKYSYKDRKTLEYLAIIAVKYRIDSSEFFNRIVEALSQEESHCKQLIIRCRKRTKDSAIFLFTSGKKVVAQFPIWTRILQGYSQLEGYMKIISAELSVKNFGVTNPKIKDLKTGMKKVNLKARVLEIPRPKMVYTRFGTGVHISNALIADQTGTVKLSLWGPQISVASINDVIQIENAYVSWFRGERQLRIGKHGKISVVKHAQPQNNTRITRSDEKKL